MATIKDIAMLAGVSHGTASNVLNGRGNVSVEKIEAVQRAAQQMGYQINAQAQSLRASKNSGVALILPDINNEQYHQLYRGLQQSLQSSFPGALDLYVTNDLPSAETDILQTLAAKSYQTIVTVSCLADSESYYQTLRLPAEQILFVYRHPTQAQSKFSLDFGQAGQAIATEVARSRPAHVGVLCETLTYTNSRCFVDALKNTLAQLSPSTQLTVMPSPASECHTAAFTFFADQPPQILIAQDTEKGRCLTQAAYLGSADPCPPIWQLSDNEPPVVSNQHNYQMDYARLGLEIARHICGSGSQVGELILENRGFALDVSYAPATRQQAESLNMLILPSPSTDALKKLLPHFYRQTGIKVNLAVYPYDEVFEILSNLHLHPYYDLLRIDMACLPWFAEKALTPLAEIAPELPDLLNNFSAEIGHHFSQIDGKAYALPFDASTQLLFYRRDLFDDPTIKRMFYEKSGKELKIPTSFDEFDDITAFFTAIHQSGNPQRPVGSSTTLGSSGLIATEYLLRYYALGGRLVHQDKPVQLEPALAVEALRQYQQQLTVTTNLNSEWWNSSVAQFEQGQLAMLIMYMNLFNDVAHSPLSPAIGYAPVPGNTPQMGGGSLGMSRFSDKKAQVEQFFRWLYSAEITEHLVLLGGNSAHRSIYQNQRILHLYPWFNLLRDNPSSGIRESRGLQGELFNLRHAEIIIGQGVTNVVNKIMYPEQAIAYINQRLLNEAHA
ncbi:MULTISPECIES: extracellular solute-binding protein [unclassified Serratia (in: enterobacteria)]|uniref:extracellular solute-binding protein n=1 Tax=unclassified Serratia (in: enterobacteria) TaxID=2647522 RepID=UPI000469D6B2|nr:MULTISPECIES: extracellular solute-binding protein [unclassified Serratia (in: enterobacteria)]